MKVLVTGATGFIGKELGKSLVRKGHQVVALSRNGKKAILDLPFPCEILEGDLTRENLTSPLLDQVDAVIHLAGENVGDGRWTDERKQKILSSRVDLTRHLIQSLPSRIQVFISASAVGSYGNRGSETLTEDSMKGQGFLADVCGQWENAVLQGQKKFSQARIVILRTGVVFAPYDGALMKMLTPFQMGVGGVLGSGEQWMSWIHLQDLIQLYVKALEDPSVKGVFNAVAPEPVRNSYFTEELVQALGVRKGPPVPALALQALYGEMSHVILDSQKVKSRLIHDFQFPTLEKALADCAAPYQDGHSVFYAEQFFALPRSQVFSFFSKSENLESITPPFLNFHMETMSTANIQKGTEINYKMRIHGVPVKWRTLIEEWVPQERFVDCQIKGPYRRWRHTHRFEELGNGTLMMDVIRYKLPFGFLGRAVSGSFVRGDVGKIFLYRKQRVPELLIPKTSV